ncbi:hypothetical protein E3N88_46124 [Mikania micrantha]|uniref:Myb/SANT-like domain-containing protein n=1 Tax=Mikania micrantha TaxID=192012 RepID=A0A5N6L7W9_9ASTR|nr:hypothetical protein E3N88_46124 [Mikania micrantha]
MIPYQGLDYDERYIYIGARLRSNTLLFEDHSTIQTPKGFLAPFRGQRYHLNTWLNGQIPEKPEEYFNMKHSEARNVIERCFGVLKKRWAILRSPSFYPIRTQNKIILACCLMHNFIRREMTYDPLDDDEFIDTNNDADDEYVGSHGTRKKQKKWNEKEDEKLVAAMLDVLNSGSNYKSDNGFKPGFFNAVEQQLAISLPNAGIKAKPHIESRIKTMKNNWSAVHDMLSWNNTSGFGWDYNNDMLDAPQPVWQAYIQRKRRNSWDPLMNSLKESAEITGAEIREATNTFNRVFGTESNREELRNNLFAEMNKVEGLTIRECDKAICKLAQNEELMVIFFKVDEERKLGWVKNMLDDSA